MSAQAQPSWTCPHCQATSYNPGDVENHYCGRCHHFCDQPPHWQVRVSGQAHGKGILVTDSIREVIDSVAAYLEGGAEVIHVYRWPAKGWTQPSLGAR